MEDFLREIRWCISVRQCQDKKDAYFNIPDNITVDQIKERSIELGFCGAEGYRIYHSKKLHVYWGYGQRTFDKVIQGYPVVLRRFISKI